MKDKMSEATPQPNQPSELDRLSRKLEQAEVAMEKSAMLSDQNEELRRMIDGVPSGLGALRIVDGKPEPRMQINRYFTDRVDIIAPENGFVSLYAFLNCLHPSERGPCRRDFHIFLMNKTPIIRQYRFRSRSGDYVWISIHGTISPLAAGMDIAYFIYTNVDELMRTEQRPQGELRPVRGYHRHPPGGHVDLRYRPPPDHHGEQQGDPGPVPALRLAPGV